MITISTEYDFIFKNFRIKLAKYHSTRFSFSIGRNILSFPFPFPFSSSPITSSFWRNISGERRIEGEREREIYTVNVTVTAIEMQMSNKKKCENIHCKCVMKVLANAIWLTVDSDDGEGRIGKWAQNVWVCVYLRPKNMIARTRSHFSCTVNEVC